MSKAFSFCFTLHVVINVLFHHVVRGQVQLVAHCVDGESEEIQERLLSNIWLGFSHGFFLNFLLNASLFAKVSLSAEKWHFCEKHNPLDMYSKNETQSTPNPPCYCPWVDTLSFEDLQVTFLVTVGCFRGVGVLLGMCWSIPYPRVSGVRQNVTESKQAEMKCSHWPFDEGGLWSTNSDFWFSDVFLLCCLKHVCLPWPPPPPPPPCLWSIFHELCAEGDSCPKHEHSCLLLRPVCTSQKGVFSVSINLAELLFIHGNVCSEDGRLFRESNQGT